MNKVEDDDVAKISNSSYSDTKKPILGYILNENVYTISFLFNMMDFSKTITLYRKKEALNMHFSFSNLIVLTTSTLFGTGCLISVFLFLYVSTSHVFPVSTSKFLETCSHSVSCRQYTELTIDA